LNTTSENDETKETILVDNAQIIPSEDIENSDEKIRATRINDSDKILKKR